MKADDFEAVKQFCTEKQIDMVVVGPEDPLVKGIYDDMKADERTKNIPVIGPSKAGAVLEGSKDFAKAFMQRHNIPTARYQTFDGEHVQEGLAFLETLEAPYVLKADGLCAGKGVLILPTLDEAKSLQTVLESGSLPVSFEYAQSQVVGPTLGQDALHAGLLVAIIGNIVFLVGLGIFGAAWLMARKSKDSEKQED